MILDWVPGHFATDEWALARFDGTPLYEDPNPQRGWHKEWGSHIFNFGRNEVRNFLYANALYWLEEFHADGLRVDGVASMLYLDYSREEGEWTPNKYGGRENLEAVQFLQEMNATVYKRIPGVTTIAEESTSWPQVTGPTSEGGLGFGFKWNMGWMHDSLGYVQHDPVHRAYHHGEMTFSLVYAWSENYVLPISHDEVVHGKGSLLRKMPGDRWRQLANLRAYLGFMWAHPGKQLLFMGAELGQESEWAEARELDWWLLDHPEHRGVHSLVRDLNAAYVASPALWQRDDDPGGFQWIDANDAGRNVFSFIRRGRRPARTSCASRTSPRSRTRATGSGCPRRASGTRCSTPTPRPTPARASATWAASTRGRGRPPRPAGVRRHRRAAAGDGLVPQRDRRQFHRYPVNCCRTRRRPVRAGPCSAPTSLNRDRPDLAVTHRRGGGRAARPGPPDQPVEAVRAEVEAALASHARVEAWVDPDDSATQRIATWSGLRREGVMRGVTVDGATVDRIVYARLADDLPAHEPEGFRALLNSFLPRKRAISQMLVRDRDGRVLLCRLTYKQDWDLPGGVVEVGESPQLAVAREVEEELALQLPAGRLLLTDWLPPWSGWDDALCLVFDGGEHDASILDDIVRQEREIRDGGVLHGRARSASGAPTSPPAGSRRRWPTWPGRSGVHRVGPRLTLPMARSRHVRAVGPGAR